MIRSEVNLKGAPSAPLFLALSWLAQRFVSGGHESVHSHFDSFDRERPLAVSAERPRRWFLPFGALERIEVSPRGIHLQGGLRCGDSRGMGRRARTRVFVLRRARVVDALRQRSVSCVADRARRDAPPDAAVQWIPFALPHGNFPGKGQVRHRLAVLTGGGVISPARVPSPMWFGTRSAVGSGFSFLLLFALAPVRMTLSKVRRGLDLLLDSGVSGPGRGTGGETRDVHPACLSTSA